MPETYIKTELTIEDLVNCEFAIKHEVERFKEKKEKSLLRISFATFSSLDKNVLQSYRNTLAKIIRMNRKIGGKGKYEYTYK
jgi:hypothetical protein